MKKLSLVLTIIAIFLLQTFNAYATSQNTNDYDLLVTFNPAKSIMLKTGLQTLFDKESEKQTPFDKATIKLLLQSNEAKSAFNNKTEGLLTFQASDTQFENLIQFTDYIETSYKNYTIYTHLDNEGEKEFTTYNNGEVITSTTLKDLTDYIDNGFTIKSDLNTLFDKRNPESILSMAFDEDLSNAENQTPLKELGIKNALLEFNETSENEFQIRLYLVFKNIPPLKSNKDQDPKNILFEKLSEIPEIQNLKMSAKKITNTEYEITLNFQADWKKIFITYLEIPDTESKFIDIEENAWYKTDVNNLKNRGIIKNDTGYYRPSDPITRAEFVNMLINYKGLENYEPAIDANIIFNDVSENLYIKDIATAYEIGLIQGDSNSKTFRPNDPLNRAEAVKILTIASGKLKSTAETPTKFKDVPEDAWYKTYLEKAYTANIVKGTSPTEFQPDKKLNRAEAAALINRLLQFEAE